ncbi:SDR family NAD(P)-dependent oxidoreductase [Solirubrobacter phytolaccae]|uniref:SDR family NAD(P)-dependent oxidoreductase n=1 Tax=Solirubrobacter phytolaccae TaxID=1404360 RepID=A0A9X3S8Y0_9ACTN|nr:SDR family NAD(P)-dependent oxidoreductase [Solirubrobacter phytolaccae]MDA0180906.1 SDR family NAD(P)-dependent oxidoreductase [Solirubrobacter phytolaccae]
MELHGAVALVTGANRGLGKAYAEALVAAGAKVYGGARNPDAVTSEGVIPVRLDVTDAEHVAQAAAELTDVNLVVNNAGIGALHTPLAADLDEARQLMEVNYFGLLRVSQAFAPQLSGGALVNVLSVASFRPLLSLSTYSATKAAAWSITTALREELPETLVVGVHAGFIDTDLAAAVPPESKIPTSQVVDATLEALRAGETEVLADDISRAAKAALVA